jgi:hypothetical protein
MKALLLAGTALLGLAVSETDAHAQRFEFAYTGKLTSFTVPIKGTYQIIAFGAQGGSGGGTGPVFGAGGRGAEIGGNFMLTKGEILQIAVGGAGSDGVVIGGTNGTNVFSGGGGGGGSFVVGSDNAALVIAGGGGGGGGIIGGSNPGPLAGQGGLTGPDGGSGGVHPSNGGTGGNGGGCTREAPSPLAGGGGGGGFFSAGRCTPDGGGAFPGLAGGIDPANGGFGGGGGGSEGAGGGGGYSGGGAGVPNFPSSFPGGGGGSFDTGTDQILVADLQIGNGQVLINLVSPVFAGTPGKANCHGQSVSALARQYGGLNAAAEALGFPSVRALQDAIMEFCEPDEAAEHDRKRERDQSGRLD